MKFDQDQLKKIGLGVVGIAAVMYGYFEFLLGPLKTSEQTGRTGIASLEPQIADAKRQINRAADLEKQAPEATAFFDKIKGSIPDGAPIAWFPPKIAKFFKKHGIEKCSAHIVSEGADPMPGFRRITWSIDLPKVEFIPLGTALASLENEEPLLQIITVNVDAAREDAQHQHATLTLTTLVKS